MKIVGLILARNEDWVLGLSARAALMWCDQLVILFHRCSDYTCALVADIALDFAGRRIVVRSSYCSDWSEMSLRQDMLEIARGLDATHIVTIDADEVLSGNLLPTIREEVENTPEGWVLRLPWLQLARVCAKCYGGSELVKLYCPYDHDVSVMSSGMWGRQNVTVAFPDDPAYHWKAQNGYDHHHRHPMGREYQPHHPIQTRDAGLMHLQFLSRRRLIAKQFWYQLTERLRWGFEPSVIRERYVPTVFEADTAKVSPCPESWWAPYAHLMQYIHIDREPWQEGECQRILMENPGIAEGLDDFGLLREWGL